MAIDIIKTSLWGVYCNVSRQLILVQLNLSWFLVLIMLLVWCALLPLAGYHYFTCFTFCGSLLLIVTTKIMHVRYTGVGIFLSELIRLFVFKLLCNMPLKMEPKTVSYIGCVLLLLTCIIHTLCRNCNKLFHSLLV